MASRRFHLMGEPVGGRWTKAKKARIVTSRVTSAQKLARAIGGRPVRLISASSFGIYPGQRGDIYTEETKLDAPRKTFIQSTLRAWENAALSATEGDAKVTVIRFGMVAGPEAYPKKLVRLFQRAGGVIVGDGEQIVPIVDIEDAVRMMRWAAQGHVGEGVFNCVSPNLPRYQDVAEAIAAKLGKPVKLRIPDWLARPILGGSADYFLLSYDIRPAKAMARGFGFSHDQPKDILARALAPYGRS
ncbi:MAG: NAD-dependent epimerase/dehydratase family protein [Rhodomicrobium sp.]|nr:NAD-dependent epimerase/dehydratase family protein [Rhodomicrobium sp.]